MNNMIITYWDWLLCPFYLIVIFTIASRIKNKYIKINPSYRFFIWGLFAKILGSIAVCITYVYYYKAGGDTISYHSSAVAYANLLLQSPSNFFSVFLGDTSNENFSYFNLKTGYPIYWGDTQATNVVKFNILLELIAFNNYIVASILMAIVSFIGVWKLYLMFCEIYPQLFVKFSIAILFMPSVVFWGSGMLKDSWTIAAAGMFTYSFYRIFINKNSLFINVTMIIISSLILISIKPYIFIALFPGSLIWGSWDKIVGIKNYILKIIIVPLVFSLGIGIGFFVWTLVSPNLGDYSSLDSMILKAHVSYEDLKQDYYQGNSFDLGTYDPTLAGVMSKFPIATITGLFRPYIWESKNIVMIFSGIENLLIMFFVIYVLVKKPMTAVINIISNPLVLFCLIFAIFFSFSVAISTSNFGALVRLRIPMIPFFISGFIIINDFNKVQKYSRYFR